ncbi:MAG: Fic family protein [Patescibacteria group bacterium]|nr:Fic family protein [Patescibacteria group bacterium]
MAKQPFIPPKLPPKLDYERLVGDISKAQAAVARLDGLLANLPNPRLLARSLITKEAVLSSKIEGTQATLGEVMEMDAKNNAAEDTNLGRDFREITNYRRALERGLVLLESKPISENVIKELHGILLQSARGQGRAPGEFRRAQVYIGTAGASIEEASYIPPPPQEIPKLFSDLEKYVNVGVERDELVRIAVAHYQFEAIHPFLDGNGRIGRLLIALMLHEKKLLSHPFVYLSEYFEANRQDYYALLRSVSERGNWEEWISFFLRGLEMQARKTQETSRRIIALNEAMKGKAFTVDSKYALEFLDAMFVNPYFSSRTIGRLVKVKNAQTLFNLIHKYLAVGIISDTTPTAKRNKVYRFDALAKLLGE